MSFDTNDPKLTAYALGELDDAERAEVEALLNKSPQARAAVAEIRQAAEMLTQELAGEPAAALTEQQRETIESALRGDAPASAATPAATVRLVKPWMVPTALAASILLVAVGILIPSVSRSRELAKRSLYLLISEPSAKRDAVNATPFGAPRDSRPTIAMGQGRVTGLEDLGYVIDGDGDGSWDYGAYSTTDPQSRDFYFVELQRGDAFDIAWDVQAANSVLTQGSSEEVAEITAWIEARDSLAQRLSEFGDNCDLPDEDRSTEAYDPVVHNPFLVVMDNPLSTFSIDVDTASYANVRRFLNSGRLPPAGAVRVEEMVNYFEYEYPGPTTADAAVPREDTAVPHETTAEAAVPHEDTAEGAMPDEITAEAAVPHPFSVNVDVGECPWVPEHRLMRVGLKGVEFEPEQRPVCNLVFLIDVSGSMSDENKLPLVKEALGLLTQELWDDDRVAMVVYAGASGLVLDSTTGRDRDAIFDALARLNAGGSTNGGEGIQLAYAVADEHFIEGGVNRVILATDGDFNVGVTNQGDLVRLIEEEAQSGVFLSVLGFGVDNLKDDTLEKLADQGELVRLIEEEAQSGVFLSVLGFGVDNLKDNTLEKLADKGNGNYAYIDTLNEARKVLVEQLSGTLVTIAKDLKIQIEFNPAEVAGYRLIGYENRVLAAQDFNDDTKDAGEIGAGHTVTALYELVPPGLEVPDSRPPEVDASGDSRASADVIPTTEGRRDLAASMEDTEQSGQIPRRSAPRNDSGDPRTGGSELDNGFSAQDGSNPATPPDPHVIAENDALPNIATDEMVDPLRYHTLGNLAAAALGISEGEVATVKLRYKLPDGDTSILMEVPVIDGGTALDETSDDFRFAASVASFGMLLRGSPYAGGWTYGAVLELASGSVGADATGYRAEFVELVERARELAEK